MTTYSPEEAAQIEYDLMNAPGAQPMYRLPNSGKRLMNEKLTIADSKITRCDYCGDHTISKLKLCSWCIAHGYPVIK